MRVMGLVVLGMTVLRAVPAQADERREGQGQEASDPPQGPRVLRAEEGFLPPEGYVAKPRRLRGLWLTGTIVGGTTWGVSALSFGLAYSLSGIFGPHEEYWLLGIIPVVGPFGIIAEGDEDVGFKAFVGGLGGVQVASVALLIAGLAAEETVWVRDDDDEPVAVRVSPAGVRIDF